MLPQRNNKSGFHRLFAGAMAAILASSLLAGPASVQAEYVLPNRLVEFEVDASAPAVARAKAEQYNNANNINKNINNVEQVVEALGPDGVKTKALRNFIMINWFYNEGASTIDDPANAGNTYLQGLRGADNDFYTRYAENMFLVFKFSSTQLSQRVLGPDGSNFAELEKGMKVILEGIKRRNPKVKYIEAGNEFDLDVPFQGAARGNLADYMKMYEAFSNAVKHVNSLNLPGEPLQLGGPTLAQFSSLLLEGFLDEALANNYQVDFISWHHYRADSVAFKEQTEIVKGLLDERQLSIPMVLSEYGWMGGGTDYNPSKEALAKNAAFMTDAVYQMSLGSQSHAIMPMTWVTSHDTAYFKNEFITGYQLSRGTADFEEYIIEEPASRQYLYVRGVGETAPGESKPENRGKPVIGIKEIKLYDENGGEIPIQSGAVSASSPAGAVTAIDSVTDGQDATYWDGSDPGTPAVESKAYLRIDLGPQAPVVKKIAIKWHNVTASSDMPVYRFRAYGSDDNIVIYDYLGHTNFTPFFHTLRMQSWLGDTLLATRGGSTDTYGVRMMATANSSDKVTMMVWNVQGDGTDSYDVLINVHDLPEGFSGRSISYKRYLTDEVHGNFQYDNDHSLDLVEESILEHQGQTALAFTLNRNAVTFIELSAASGDYQLAASHGAAVEASSNSAAAAYIADGDPATAWTAADASFPQFVTLDLGRAVSVTGAAIDWAHDQLGSYRYKLETSLNGTDYTMAADETKSAGAGVGGADYKPQPGDSMHSFQAEARYVRLTVTGTADEAVAGIPASIRDLKVWTASQALLDHSFDNGQLPPGWAADNNSRWAGIRQENGEAFLRTNITSGNVAQGTFGEADWADYTAEVKVRSSESINMDANFNPALLIRANGTTAHNNAYRIRLVGNQTARLYKVVSGGVGDILAQANLPFAIQPQTWYTLKVEAVGNQFKFYVDDQLVLEFADNNARDTAYYANGKVGLMAGNVNVDFKDIKVSPIAAAIPQLADIRVNGSSIPGFNSAQTTYSVVLPAGTSAADITATAANGTVWLSADGHADLSAVQGGHLKYVLGAQAADGSMNYYSLYLRTASADASLERITFSAGEDPVLIPGKYDYDVSLPAGTGGLSILEAVPAAAGFGAKAEVVQQPVLDEGRGTAVVRVTAENGAVSDYTFRLTARPTPVRGELLYEENFNDGSIKAGWSQPAINQFRVVEDQYGERYGYRDVNASNILISNSTFQFADADISARVKATDSIAYPGLLARVSADEKNFYMLRIKPNEDKVSLGKMVNDSLKEPGSLTVSMPLDLDKWYQLRLVLEGNRIKAYVDDALLFDVTDGDGVFDTAFTPLPTGRAGFRVANARAGLDDLLVTSISQANTAPAIALIGAAEVTVPVGGTYEDQGATAFDAEDGDITHRIVTTGEVDVHTAGSYVIRYNVTDSQGAAAVEVTRTVHVASALKSYNVAASGPLSRTGTLEAAVTVAPVEGVEQHEGKEVIYFQLLNGTTPVSWVAVEEDIAEQTELSAYFAAVDPGNPAYTVRVFVLNSLLPDWSQLPEPLSNKLILE